MGGRAQADEEYFYIKINKKGINKIKLLNSRLLTMVSRGRKGSDVISTFRAPLKVLIKIESPVRSILAPLKPNVSLTFFFP